MPGYELTREDIEKIALTGKACEDLASDISEIKRILQDDARNCSKCKDGLQAEIQVVHGRINKIVKTHTGEAAVRSWTDHIYTKIGAGIVAFCSIGGLILSLKGGP
jgi:hypothetical protein